MFSLKHLIRFKDKILESQLNSYKIFFCCPHELKKLLNIPLQFKIREIKIYVVKSQAEMNRIYFCFDSNFILVIVVLSMLLHQKDKERNSSVKSSLLIFFIRSIRNIDGPTVNYNDNRTIYSCPIANLTHGRQVYSQLQFGCR